MSKDITIEGVNKAKKELEKNIKDLLAEFEEEYGVKLGSYINIVRSKDLETIEAEVAEDNKKDISDVGIEMKIDVL